MSNQLGRISGPLLKDNLLRDGIDLAFENDLLYFDVNTQKIGINSSAPIRDLFVETDVSTTNLIVDNHVTITTIGFIDQSSEIGTLIDDLIFTGTEINFTHTQIGGFDFDVNKITQVESNADIEFRPNGSGIFKVVNDLWVDGSLHVTGDITFDGNITLGSYEDDNVFFSADVASNLLPNLDNTYSLGSVYKKWNFIYADFLNGQVVNTTEVETGSGASLATRQGNIWYVAVNGTYSNVGDHQNGPFGSLEKALSVATFGDTVYVYPGTYYELFPLVVPAGVTVTGTDLRNTVIVPDTASEFEDVFYLNDQSTVQNLTIKNFYFDSINNKGYAFRFAPNIQVVNRSPYIQNISVITKGTVTSISDPLGFLSGDAGKGAYIDGSIADSSSNQASMLFHSATFITPGVDCITMLNGVRVEWLNSFTYYANRGLYAQQGVSGFASLGSIFGAEVRSIGSANVYGTYGAEADGADTLMYLINHNFAYIGTGKDASNDKTLVIQANETVELNSGKIHYTSFDHKGTFRVGDTFFIDLEDGTTSFDLTSVSANTLVGVKLIDGDLITYIDFSKIETGNIEISGNLIRSTTGAINFSAASGETNIDQDVFITKNLSISNNFSIDGQLNLGNAITDTVRFDAEIDDNLDPKLDNTYNLGSSTRNWKNIFTRKVEIADIEIFTNYIRTQVSNSDLELRANGTGSILVENIRANQNVISTDSGNIQINPNTTLDITASTVTTNTPLLYVTNDLYVNTDTIIGTNSSNTVYFKSSVNSSIEPQFDQIYALGDEQRSWNLFTASILLDDIEINDNYIRTTVSNLNLEFKASGTGSIQVEKTYFNENEIYTVGTNLKIEPATTLDITASTTNVNGMFHVTGNVTVDSDITFGDSTSDIITYNSYVNTNIVPQLDSRWDLGDTDRAWNLYTSSILLDDIEINDNYIRTIASNLDLELKANGTGSVIFEKTRVDANRIYTVGTNLKIEPATTLDITSSLTTANGNLFVSNNVVIDSNTTFGNASSDTVIFNNYVATDIIPNIDSTHMLGDTARTWNLYTDKILLDEIEINDNYIITKTSNLNLELKANGTGAVRFEQVDFNENIIRTNGTTNLELRPATTLDIFATTSTVNGNLEVTGNFNFDGTITIGNQATDTIAFLADVDSDLLPDVDNTYDIGSLPRRWHTLWAENGLIGDIEVNTNFIRTVSGNLDLTFQGNSTGGILIEDLRFRSNALESKITNQNITIPMTGTTILDIDKTNALKVATGITADRPTISMLFGDMRFNTSDNLFGGFTTARTTFGGVYSADRLTYARVEPTSNIITFSSQGTTAAYVDSTKMWLNGLQLDSFTVQANVWSTNNINLLFDPDLNNPVEVDNIRFDDNKIINLSNNAITLANTGSQGYVKFNGTYGIVIPAGTQSERPLTPENGTTRWNTEDEYLEIYFSGTWQLATATSGSAFASEAEVEEIGYLYSLILG